MNLILPWLLAGCGSTALDVFETCSLEVSLGTETALPGDEVVATGGPQFSTFDTVVRVEGTPARVLGVDRSAGCDVCDACRTESGCLPCGFCPACDDACSEPDDTGAVGDPPPAGCLETVRFEVPSIAVGPATVVVVNRYGTSPPTTLQIVGATGTGDTGGDTADTSDTSDTAVTSTTATADTGP